MFVLLSFFTLSASAGLAPESKRKTIAYEQITALSSAVGMTAATYDGAGLCVLQAETQTVRYRSDGTDPTASVGMRLTPDVLYPFSGEEMSDLKFIEQDSGAKLNIECYE